MKIRFMAPPWGAPALTTEARELAEAVADNVWADAAVKFYAERDAKVRSGKTAPKGMQKTLNSIIEERLLDRGWAGDSGYYFKNETWVRVTFRHQMSLGSDFIDAIKVCKKEGIRLAIILAASRETLKVVSPNDCNALISFEKLQDETLSLDGAVDIPLLIGELTPYSNPSKAISDELMRERPRDVTVPAR